MVGDQRETDSAALCRTKQDLLDRIRTGVAVYPDLHWLIPVLHGWAFDRATGTENAVIAFNTCGQLFKAMTVTPGLVLWQIVCGRGPFCAGSDENMRIGPDRDFIVEAAQCDLNQTGIAVAAGEGQA